MTSDQVEHYANGGLRLSQGVRGLTAGDMAVAGSPGMWSIHDLVIHVADAEAALADRMKRVIAMDEPNLLAWDENAFHARLRYDQQSVEDAVAIVELTRRQMSRVLLTLPSAVFDRVGIHNGAGRMTLAEIVAKADRHLDHHLTFVAGKRERMGKLMW